MDEINAIDLEISKIIDTYNPNLFNDTSIRIFRYQYKKNSFYRRSCNVNGDINIDKVKHYSEIPPVSVREYKVNAIRSTIQENSEGFYLSTSGTTIGLRGKIYRDSAFFSLRDKATFAMGKTLFFHRFYPKKVMIVFLDIPNKREIETFKPSFSMLNTIKHFFGSKESCFLDLKTAQKYDRLKEIIVQCNLSEIPMVLFGPSYRISQFVYNILHQTVNYDNTFLNLPLGSMVMDSGGLKNLSAHIDYDSYKRDLFYVFGLNREDYINTYALSETGSQFPDNTGLHNLEICKQSLPWAKVRIVKKKQNQFVDCKVGEEGEIIVYDLLNRGSILALQTHDIAVKTNHGFNILRRNKV